MRTVLSRFAPVVLATWLAGSSCADEARIPVVRVDPEMLTFLSPLGDALWNVRDMVSIGDTVWVLTAEAPFVHAFGPRSQRLVAFGSAGEGPGELRSPQAILPWSTDVSVAVWDPGVSAVQVFSATGLSLSKVSLPRPGFIRADIRDISFGDPFRVTVDSLGMVMAVYDAPVTRANDLWHGRLVRVTGGDPTELQVIVDFDRDLGGSTLAHDMSQFLLPVPLWDACPDGRIAILDPIVPALTFATQSRNHDVHTLVLKPRRLRPIEQLAYIKAIIRAESGDLGLDEADLNDIAAQTRSRLDGLLPTDAPIAVDMICAEDRVWIQEFDRSSWRSIHPTSGASAIRVEFPHGFTPFSISQSRIVGVVTDSFALQRVAAVDLGFHPMISHSPR